MNTKEYTHADLRSLESELQPYWESKVLRDGTKIQVINYDKFYVDKGIYRHHPTSKTYGIVESKIRDYENTEEMLRQLGRLKGKREFAKNKQVEQQVQGLL